MSKEEKEIIKKIQKALSNEIDFIRQEKEKTTESKITQINVLLDTMKFLQNYNENVEVLNKYIRKKEREGR